MNTFHFSILTIKSETGKSVLGLLPLTRPWSRSLRSAWSSEPTLSLEYKLSLSVGDLLFSRIWLSERLRCICGWFSPADFEWAREAWFCSNPMPLSAAAEFEEARRMVYRIELSNSHVKQHERVLYYTPLHVGSMTNAPLCNAPLFVSVLFVASRHLY